MDAVLIHAYRLVWADVVLIYDACSAVSYHRTYCCGSRTSYENRFLYAVLQSWRAQIVECGRGAEVNP